jgi:hypothetical protein
MLDVIHNHIKIDKLASGFGPLPYETLYEFIDRTILHKPKRKLAEIIVDIHPIEPSWVITPASMARIRYVTRDNESTFSRG